MDKGIHNVPKGYLSKNECINVNGQYVYLGKKGFYSHNYIPTVHVCHIFSYKCTCSLSYFHWTIHFNYVYKGKVRERDILNMQPWRKDGRNDRIEKEKPEKQVPAGMFLPGGTQIPGKILRVFALRVSKILLSLLSRITATPTSMPRWRISFGRLLLEDRQWMGQKEGCC